jgi:threonine aldolase
MRRAMAEAEVGDDVFGEDPTVNRLQARVAELLGKEAALFTPSGTMANLVAIRTHCHPGDEMICEAHCHLLHYEQAGYAQMAGVAARPVEGRNGVLTVEQLQGLIRPPNAHFAQTRLLTLENTHNRGGGTIQPYPQLEAICRWAAQHGLRRHLDGARLWNAAVATGIPPAEWAKHFDTVTVCFSKGLGAPVGSALVGPKDLIQQAHRHRKVLGGGMRQAGILAAAALYALEHHIDRLAEDHANARRLAEQLRRFDLLELDPPWPETNMVFFRVSSRWGSPQQLADALRQEGILVLPTAEGKIRLVTHLDVTAADIDRLIQALEKIFRQKG